MDTCIWMININEEVILEFDCQVVIIYYFYGFGYNMILTNEM